MDKERIIQRINEQLSGELLTYNQLEPFLDQVIDDINSKLDTTFPSFSEFTQDAYPERYPNYNFFPDKYIRSVVIIGAAYKWFLVDEEGIPTATQFQYDYEDHLFIMLRDFLEHVPEEFQANSKASVEGLSDVAYKPDVVGGFPYGQYIL